ncbi:MAG: molybdopterin-dependent oxidoreductase [Thermoleophilia bacterium]|nr:molybdopterin-dependent oxidoreductase [Thermoleophilia bacterium]
MKKRGFGIASIYYGIGNTGLPNPASVFLEVLEDGSVCVLCGASDMGQGSSTTLAQIVATGLGVPVETVRVTTADSDVTPDAGVSSGTRQTYVSGNAACVAASQAGEIVGQIAAEEFFYDVPVDEIRTEEGLVFPDNDRDAAVSFRDVVAAGRAAGQLIVGSGRFNPQNGKLDPETGQGEPYGAYAFGTQLAEVEVDTETGEVTVLRLRAAHDLGTAVNPQSAEGQIEGGVSMGLGYATMEEVLVEEGRLRTRSFTEYLIPTTLDMPVIEPVLVEEWEESGPFGAKGLGEPPACATAAAILNAIYDAVGVRLDSLPATAEAVYLALRAKERASTPAVL